MKEQTLNSLSKRGPSYQHYQKPKKKKKKKEKSKLC